MTLKILIIDDHEVARAGISDLVLTSGFAVAGSVSSGREAIEILNGDSSVDIVMLDIRMPDSDGLNTLEQIRTNHPSLIVVVMSAYDNPTYIARAAALGAHDYLLKSAPAGLVQSTLQHAFDGKLPPEDSRLAHVSRMMSQEILAADLPPELPLTSREAQVLRHVAFGLSNKEIAKSLTISVETVKEHVQNILRKTSCSDRTDAAVRAVKLGLADWN